MLRRLPGSRRWIVFVATGGLLGILLVNACADALVARASGSPSADAALETFGRAHPQCRLWTDWQKICSRTGSRQSVECRPDPERLVAPSEPFCMVESGGDRAWQNYPRQRLAADRFCVAHDVEAARVDAISGRSVTERACSRFNPDRPFNGRRISARRHPWCEEWSDVDRQRVVCSEAGARTGGIPSCPQLARQGYQHSGALYCSRWRAPSWCASPRAFYDSVPSGEFLARGAASPDWIAAYGIYCERTE